MGIFNLLGPDALFFLLPIACACFGFLVGRGMHYPFTGTVFGTSLFAGYVATMPLVRVLCYMLFPPSNTVAYIMNSYWMPYGEWADCFNAWAIIKVWEGFASQTPIVAASIVFVTFTGINFSTFLAERRTSRKAAIS